MILIKEDNQGTTAVANNPISHNRTKHIDIKLHYVHEALEYNIIDLIYCPTDKRTAYILTKPLARKQFEAWTEESNQVNLSGSVAIICKLTLFIM